MKNHLFLGAALLIILFTQQSAYADSPSFTYVELEYVANGTFAVANDDLSVDLGLDGFALTGSVELGIFLLQASRFELESGKILNSNIEDSISSIAVGLTFELPKANVYGLIRGRRDELALTGGGFEEDEDLNSVGFEVGARINLTDRFELNANLGKPTLDEGSSFGVGAQFFMTDNLGITLDFNSVSAEDDDIKAEFDTTSLGLRFTF